MKKGYVYLIIDDSHNQQGEIVVCDGPSLFFPDYYRCYNNIGYYGNGFSCMLADYQVFEIGEL